MLIFAGGMDGNAIYKRRMAHEGEFIRVSARSCEIRRIGRADFFAFMEANHDLGSTSCRYRYGLFTTKDGPFPAGTLVAAAGFSSARNLSVSHPDGTMSVSRSCEWVRYASLPDVRVRGGMGKVLKRFIAEAGPDDVMSYSPVGSWPEAGGYARMQFGDAYRRLGFRAEGRKVFPDGTESMKYRLTVHGKK